MSHAPHTDEAQLLEDAARHFLNMRRLNGASDELARNEFRSIATTALRSQSELRATDDGTEDGFAPMPEDALRGIAGRFVRLIEPHTESDSSGVLVQFLVAFGNSLGRGAHVRVEDDRHYGNLFALIVGTTARGRKGTSWRRVQNFVGSVDAGWLAECVQPGGLSSGEGLIWAVRDASLDGSLPGVSEKRQLIVEGEFASVLKVLGREGNTLSPVLRSAWDGGSLSIKTKSSPCRATGAHTSIIGHVTRDEFLRRLDLAEVAGGLVNRFLFASVRRSKLLPEGGQPPASALDALAVELRRAHEFGRVERVIPLDAGARALWHEVYPILSGERVGLYGAATARAEAQTLRVALLYAVLDLSTTIRTEHLLAALALWSYCDQSALYVIGSKQGDKLSDDVLLVLRGHADWMSRTELVDALGRHASGARLQQALDAFLAAGTIEAREEETGGRPRMLYRARKARKAPFLDLCSLSSPIYADLEARRATGGVRAWTEAEPCAHTDGASLDEVPSLPSSEPAATIIRENDDDKALTKCQ